MVSDDDGYSETERWEKKYKSAGILWGEQESVLATAATRFLEGMPRDECPRSLLDLGCGYGRDLVSLARNLPHCTITGIDSSTSAVEAARRRCAEGNVNNVVITCTDYRAIRGERFDSVYCSNIYHLLRRDERMNFGSLIQGMLNPGGYLFLSTLSPNDPEHGGKGQPVPGDPGSFVFPEEDLWLHFAPRDELLMGFSLLHLPDLYEVDYTEPRIGGDHHHVSWILIGRVMR